MLLTITLVVVLAASAGLIAYMGDVLGTTIGKRRLSLFGARPKQTGRIIGVLTGVLIMVITVGTIALVSRNTIINTFRFQQSLTQRQALLADLNQIQRQAADVSNQLAISQENLASVQAESERLQVQNSALVQENASLEDLNETLTAEVTQIQGQLVSQQDAYAALLTLRDDLARSVSNLEQQFKALEDGGLTYLQGQTIYSAIINSQDPTSIREELSRFMTAAQDSVILRGASSITPLTVEESQFLTEAIAETPNGDILTFSSPTIQFQASVVDRSIDLRENDIVLEKGQLISSQAIYLQSPVDRADITTEITRLTASTKSRLLRLNRLSGYELQYAGLSTDAFAEQLSRLEGPATIGMLASEDIYVAGTAQIELAIIY